MRLSTVMALMLVAVGAASLRADDAADAWRFKSATATNALEKYQAARDKLDEAHQQDRRANRAQLIAHLQAHVKTATQAGDLDGALALRDAIQALQVSPPSTASTAEAADNQAIQAEPARNVFLDDLTELESSLDYPLEKHGMMSDGDKQMRAFVRGKQFEHSLFTHPPGSGKRNNRSIAMVSYKLDKAYRSFKSSVALADGSPIGTPVTFCVYGDGRALWRSKPVISQGAVQKFTLGIRNVQVLTLQVECPGPNSWRQAIWLSPELTVE